MARRFVAWLALSLGGITSFSSLVAQSTAPRAPTLLQVTLENSLDTLRLQPGAAVLASALVPWKGRDCVLKTGATVYGRVTAVESKHKGQHESSLTVVFDRADCNGERAVPITLVLFAVINSSDDPSGQQAYASELFGATSLRTVANAPSNTSVPVDNRVLLGSVGLANSAAHMSQLHTPASVKAGEVIDAGKVTLTVGTGPDTPSVLRSDKRDFEINRSAELVLLPISPPAPATPVLAKREEPVPVIAPRPAEPPPPPEVTEICAATECSDMPDSAQNLAGAVRSIPLAQLGYHPRRSLRMSEFDRDTTVTYLSPQQLLVTFDLHRLRSRGGWPGTVRRVVRAVVLDSNTGKVQRVADWTVEGSSQYLWPAGPGRVLVHMAGALRVLGPGLTSEAVLPAAGELLWVSVSPSGRRIALAVIHERHTHETHEQIATLTSLTPEEDVEVNVFDARGTLLSGHAETSHIAAPVLTDDAGEIIIRRQRNQRWQILEQVGETTRTIAAVDSMCPPSVSATSSDGLFVQGCATGGRWFRMLHKNGRTFMKDAPSDQKVEQRALASGDSVYAIRVVDLYIPPDARLTFPAEAVRDEKVSVRRSSDGHELMLAQLQSFPQTRNSFALSTDEKHLALLTEKDVAIYLVPAGAKPSPH